MLKQPAFWWRDRARPGPVSHLLVPLGALYARATAHRLARPPVVRPSVPTICVGNLTIGGSGKTPTTIALVDALKARGRRPFVVTRGYGGRLPGPTLVDPATMAAADVGDESLLLAAFAAVVASRDRAAGAAMALAHGADVILLDDGFQNPAVARDLNLVVVDAATGFGNGRVLPAGPLREPVATGLARADVLVAIGSEADRSRLVDAWPETRGIPRLDAELVPLATGMDWRGLRVAAFAGIGRPEKFFATLRSLGADLARTIPLADHQPLTPALLARLARDAAVAKAQLVTTEKDAVRLPPAFRQQVLTLPVRLRWDDEAALSALLDRLLDG